MLKETEIIGPESNIRRLKHYIVGMFVLVISLSNMHICFAAEIRWELNFPFRLFHQISKPRDLSSFAVNQNVLKNWKYRRDLYFHPNCVKQSDPILCSELLRGEKRRDQMMQLLRDPRPSDRRPFSSNVGYGTSKDSNAWLAERFLDTGSYYSGAEMRYLKEKYIRPNKPNHKRKPGSENLHKARVWLNGSKFRGRNCIWIVDGKKSRGSCGGGINANLQRGKNSSKIEVRTLKNNPIASLSGKGTFVREVTIVAMGDSYASGEGAPDIAAKTTFKKGTNKPERVLVAGTLKDNFKIHDNAAHWKERNCHRSYLSGQTRSAIHYAATHPKIETTYLHTACSGAEVVTGLIGPYSGIAETNLYKRELDGNPNRKAKSFKTAQHLQLWRSSLSQINMVIEALCANPKIPEFQDKFNRYFKPLRSKYLKNNNGFSYSGRKTPAVTDFHEILECDGGFTRDIDVLLVGIGGNDTGFSRVIRHLLNSPPERAISAISGNPTLSPPQAGGLVKKVIPQLFSNKIEFPNPFLKTQSDTKTFSGLAWHVTNSLKINEPQRVILSAYPLGLKGSLNEFCHSGIGLKGLDIIRVISPFVSAKESKAIVEEYGSQLNSMLKKIAFDRNWRFADEHVEKFDRHGWCADEDLIDEPHELNAYRTTKRWVRTPDDGTFFQHRLPSEREKEAENRLTSRLFMSFGLFHPNGMGHAVIADSYFNQIVNILD